MKLFTHMHVNIRRCPLACECWKLSVQSNTCYHHCDDIHVQSLRLHGVMLKLTAPNAKANNSIPIIFSCLFLNIYYVLSFLLKQYSIV